MKISFTTCSSPGSVRDSGVRRYRADKVVGEAGGGSGGGDDGGFDRSSTVFKRGPIVVGDSSCGCETITISVIIFGKCPRGSRGGFAVYIEVVLIILDRFISIFPWGSMEG